MRYIFTQGDVGECGPVVLARAAWVFEPKLDSFRTLLADGVGPAAGGDQVVAAEAAASVRGR